jgi:hypothetical protein
MQGGGGIMWLCPYCGCENPNDDRIGMQEPKCRDCKNERITAEKLEIIKDKEVGDLKTDLTEQARSPPAKAGG